MRNTLKNLEELLHYPSAVVGLMVVLLLVAVSIYTVIAIPYQTAINLWRGGEGTWYRNPKNAAPAWTNFFRTKKLPVTLDFNTATQPSLKTVKPSSLGESISISIPFDYNYDAFPTELTVFFTSQYANKLPFVSLSWKTPDGRTIRLQNFSITTTQNYRITQDTALQTRLGGVPVAQGLLAVPGSNPPQVLKGRYLLQIDGVAFQKDDSVNAEFVSYGQLYGLAGTDHLRRDLMVALLWGTPVALGLWPAGCGGHHLYPDVHCRRQYLVRRDCRHPHPAGHRGQPGLTFPAHPDYDRHVLFAQHLGHPDFGDRIEHFWSRH